jgi:predicted nuclease of predicted toxin-antitoxin system
MARLYSNENFPLPVVEHLRGLGHDVLTIQETGQADQALSDVEVLAFAAREQRALLTLNRRHFIRLHQENSRHGRIHQAIGAQASLAGQLIRVNRP